MRKAKVFRHRTDNVTEGLDRLHGHAEEDRGPARHREEHVHQGPLFVAPEFLEPYDGVEGEGSDEDADAGQGHPDPLERLVLRHEGEEVLALKVVDVISQVQSPRMHHGQ